MPLTPVQLVGGSYTSRARSLDLSMRLFREKGGVAI
jgi:hypothetical protein